MILYNNIMPDQVVEKSFFSNILHGGETINIEMIYKANSKHVFFSFRNNETNTYYGSRSLNLLEYNMPESIAVKSLLNDEFNGVYIMLFYKNTHYKKVLYYIDFNTFP